MTMGINHQVNIDAANHQDFIFHERLLHCDDDQKIDEQTNNQ
jgi:hypothetical protein